ncbi:hypothetical protein ACOSP7_009939 [Xanthoceras sorbifolium]
MEEIFAIGRQDDANKTEVVHEIKLSELGILRLEYNIYLGSKFLLQIEKVSPLQLTSDTKAKEIISE